MNENLYLYILMRTDLPSMGSGRAAAQASHAASAFAKKYGTTEGYKKWAKQTNQGFGTAIVLGTNKQQMHDLHRIVFGDYFSEIITDPDYAITVSSEIVGFLDTSLNSFKIEQSKTDSTKYILHREEETCSYIFGDKDALQPILGHLPLYS